MMSTALGEARRRYPQLEIRMTSVRDETGAELVRRGQLDMVILSRFGSAHAPVGQGLREFLLGHDALKLCVPAGHRLDGAAELHARRPARRALDRLAAAARSDSS